MPWDAKLATALSLWRPYVSEETILDVCQSDMAVVTNLEHLSRIIELAEHQFFLVPADLKLCNALLKVPTGLCHIVLLHLPPM